MSNPPFMQLYVGDYLADTLDLTCEEHGAYLLLLMTMWRNGGKLPNDTRKLARVTRLSAKKWGAVWAEIGRFFDDDGEHITNARLTKEYQKAASKSESRADAGSKGGAAKALKYKERHVANATVLPCHSSEPEPDIRKEDTNVSLSVSTDVPCPANEISDAVSRYNLAAERAGWPQVQKLTPSRSKQLRARLKDSGGMAGWEDALRRAFASDFCRGRTPNPWTGFGFDWLTKAANFTKLMEGNYDNRSDSPKTTGGNAYGSKQPASLASIVARRRNQHG